MTRRLLTISALAALAACGSTQAPASLSQAKAIYSQLSASGAERRAGASFIKAQEAINQADVAVAQRQNSEYVAGISEVALKLAQTAEAENATALAKDSTVALRTARLNRLVTLSQAQRDQLAAQNLLSQAEIEALRQRNLLVSQQAESLKVKVTTTSQQADSLRGAATTATQQADSLRKVAEQANAALNAALSQLRTLVVEITNLRQTSRGLVVSLSDVLFDVDKATLKPGAANNIQKVAAVLKQYPDHKIAVEGHTDATGTHDHNQKLSEDRAAAVKAALIAGGVDASKITSTGLAETQPVATNSTAAGRQQNRRVEVVVLGAGTLANPGSAMISDTTKTRITVTDTVRTKPPR